MKEQTIDVNEFSNGKGHNSTSEKASLFYSPYRAHGSGKVRTRSRHQRNLSEAKAVGFDTKIMKIIIKRRKIDADKRKRLICLSRHTRPRLTGHNLTF